METSSNTAPPHNVGGLFVFLVCAYLFFMNPSFMGYDVESYLV